MRAESVFKVVDAVGDSYLFTIADSDYAPQFRKHVAWWKRHVKTREYRDKVPSYRWPVFPVRIVIEERQIGGKPT